VVGRGRIALATMLTLGFALTSAPAVKADSGPDISVHLITPARLHTTHLLVATIVVTNAGSETATGLSIDGGVGDQFNPVSMKCLDNGSIGVGSCNPRDLAPGASVKAKFTAYVCCFEKGESPNSPVTASVSTEGWTDPTPDDDWVQNIVHLYGPFIPSQHKPIGPDVSVTIKGPATVKSMSTVTYTAVVRNVGHAQALGVHLTVTIPDQFSGRDFDCHRSTFTGYDCTGSLAPGGWMSATYKVCVCGLVQGETRSTRVMADVTTDFVDQNPANNSYEKAVFITGKRIP
jgi:uncharacterized repeat protein (TIGR01451 family)